MNGGKSLFAPRDGRYRYRYVADDPGAPHVDIEVVATITTTRRTSEQVLQRTRYDAHLAGSDTAWRPDGEHVVAAGEKSECAFEPAIRRVPLPLAVGAHWTGEGTCTVGEVRQALRVEGRVAGRDSVKVGKATVEVFRLEMVTTDVGQASGVARLARRTTTELFAPSLGVAVSTETRIEPGPGSTGGTRKRVLLALP